MRETINRRKSRARSSQAHSPPSRVESRERGASICACPRRGMLLPKFRGASKGPGGCRHCVSWTPCRKNISGFRSPADCTGVRKADRDAETASESKHRTGIYKGYPAKPYGTPRSAVYVTAAELRRLRVLRVFFAVCETCGSAA